MTGPPFLAAVTNTGRPDYHIDIFTGLLDVDPNLFFLPPTLRSLRRRPIKVHLSTSHRLRRGSAFSVKYWNKLPASVVTTPSVNIFKKRLEKVWTEVVPHLPF